MLLKLASSVTAARPGSPTHAVLGAWTYFEFFLLAVLYLPVLFTVQLLYRRASVPRIPGRFMRRFGRLTSFFTPLWKFSVDGEPPSDIQQRAYVVVCNHESSSDPFLISWQPWDMRWIVKDELRKAPITGWLIRWGGDIPLVRGNRQSVEAMMAECERTLAAGLPIMIFPEGTRSPDGELLPFKDGAFSLAIQNQTPVLPMALFGTRECRPKDSLWFGHARARCRVLSPVSTEGMTLDDLPRLKERVREQIAAARSELRRELQHGQG